MTRWQGYHYGEPVVTIGFAYCAGSLFVFDGPGDLRVRGRLPVSNRKEVPPHFFLKPGAQKPCRHCELGQLPCKVLGELLPSDVENGINRVTDWTP